MSASLSVKKAAKRLPAEPVTLNGSQQEPEIKMQTYVRIETEAGLVEKNKRIEWYSKADRMSKLLEALTEMEDYLQKTGSSGQIVIVHR